MKLFNPGPHKTTETDILNAVHNRDNLNAAGTAFKPEVREALLQRIRKKGISDDEAQGAEAVLAQLKDTPAARIIEGLCKQIIGEHHDQSRIKTAVANLLDPVHARKPSKDWVNHLPPAATAEQKQHWINIINDGQSLLQNTVNHGELHHGFHAATVFAELSTLTLYPNAAIPDDARVGWMAKNPANPNKPAVYESSSRASNGQGCPYLAHKESDVRGLSLLSDSASFTATNQNAGAHVHNTDEFAKFAEANARATSKGFSGLLAAGANGVQLLKAFGRNAAAVLLRLGKDTTIPPDSLATQTYTGSITRLGDYTVRVVFLPDPKAEQGTKVDGVFPKEDPRYLAKDAANRGSKKFICCLQFWTDEKNTPLNDATKPWKSPLIPVGEVVTTPFADAALQEKVSKLLTLARVNPGHVDAGPAPAGHPELGASLVDGMSPPRKEIYDASADKRGALSQELSLALVHLLHKVRKNEASTGERATFDKLLGVVDRMDQIVAQREAGKIEDAAAWTQIKALRQEVATHLRAVRS